MQLPSFAVLTDLKYDDEKPEEYLFESVLICYNKIAYFLCRSEIKDPSRDYWGEGKNGKR